jgi:hypothetical protein
MEAIKYRAQFGKRVDGAMCSFRKFEAFRCSK